MLPALRTLLRALCCLAALPAVAADLSIMPVNVQLDGTRDRATVQVVNQGNAPLVLQAEAVAWERRDGQERDDPTADLIVNPPLFTLPPGQSQIVRLGLRKRAASSHEGTYRLVLREVPQQPTEADRISGGVRLLLALRVPVYVAPTVVQRDERWQLRRDRDGSLVAQVTNAGNVHLKVATLRLHAGAAGSSPVAEAPVGALLLPGEGQSVRLRPRVPVGDTPITLEVLTDRGPQYVALAVAPD